MLQDAELVREELMREGKLRWTGPERTRGGRPIDVINVPGRGSKRSRRLGSPPQAFPKVFRVDWKRFLGPPGIGGPGLGLHPDDGEVTLCHL